jgi:hypothetical protein
MSKQGDEKSNPVEDVVILAPKVMTVDELAPAKDNPREWNGTRMGRLKASLRRFGMVEPLVWNERTQQLVGGHMRLSALKAMGVKEVPVVRVNITAQEEMALRLTLNNRAAQGRWHDRVKAQVAETQLQLPDFWKELAIGEILDQLGGDAEPKGGDEEEVKFKKGKKGKFVVKPCSQKVAEMAERKLQEIADLNKFEGKSALASALELVFADLEPAQYGPGKKERGG